MKYVKLNVSFLNGPELSCEYSLVFYPTSWEIIAQYWLNYLKAQLGNNCPEL